MIPPPTGGSPPGGPPDDAFVDPFGRNREQVTRLLRRSLDAVLAASACAASRPPMPRDPSVPASLLPERPRDPDEILADLEALLRSSMNAAHPGYMGHMDSLPTTFSLVGDLAAAALNNNLLSVELSPAFSRLEPALARAIAGRFGLPEGSGGQLAAGGSLANLHGLAVARNLRFGTDERPLTGAEKAPVVLASEAAHTSFHKAAMLLGLGREGVAEVPVDGDGRMRTAALRERIRDERDAGREPFCVVAIAGTTVTGNIDPLGEVGAIARDEGLWFHVDAAYGGALAFAGRERARLAGIEAADSIVFNPQKWMYVAKTCAMVLFRDLTAARARFRIGKPYFGAEGDLTNLGEVGVQGTRQADVLKLWLSLQHLGLSGYAELLDGSYRRTREFVEAIRARPFLRLATEPETNIVCFRGVPSGREGTEGADDEWNEGLRDHLGEHGFFLSLPRWRGHRWLRAVLLNPWTGAAEIAGLFDAVDRWAARA